MSTNLKSGETWSKEREERVLGLEDDDFLNAVETWELKNRARLYVDGEEVGPGVLERLLKMADARPVLREIEWSGAHKTCPSCGGFKPGEPKPSPVYRSGHDSECQLSHVLKA